MNVVRACISFLLLSSIVSPACAQVLDELIKRQKGITTVEAKFRQEKKTALMRKPIKSSGVFFFRSPMGVRWQYDEGLLVIYDGKYLYIYSPEMEVAEKVTGVAQYTGPLAFDIGFLSKEFVITAEKSSQKVMLNLKPRGKMPLESMQMEFPASGAAFPEVVTVREATGDATVITFSGVKTNRPLKEGLFIFKPPPGVKIHERAIDQ